MLKFFMGSGSRRNDPDNIVAATIQQVNTAYKLGGITLVSFIAGSGLLILPLVPEVQVLLDNRAAETLQLFGGLLTCFSLALAVIEKILEALITKATLRMVAAAIENPNLSQDALHFEHTIKALTGLTIELTNSNRHNPQ